jgi:hypothetical protein
MKKYLFMGGLVLSLSTGVYADNPFDIAKNMQKIEAEDSMLLDTLEEENVKKGDIKSDDFVVSKNVKEEEVAPAVIEEAEVVTEPEKEQEPKKQEIQEETTKVENVSVEIEKEPVSKPQEIKEPVQKVVKEEPKKEEVEQPAPKVEPKPVETQMPKVEPKPVATQEPKKETKKQEPVKIEDDKPKAPSVADINLTKEKEDAALRAKKELEEAIKEVDMED